MPAAKIEIRMDQAAIRRLERGRGGDVMKDLTKRARRTQALARRYAPGRMGRTVRAVIEDGHVRVECTHPAVMYVIRGTRRHVIRPRFKQALKFTMNGRITFAKKVNHPGTRKNDFLTRALREGARR